MYHHGNFYNAYLENIQKCNLKVNTWIGDSIEKSKIFNNNSIDFLFIDGCHDYPYVAEELLSWMPKLKKNSMVAGHDYSLSGIQKATKSVLGNVKVISNGNSYYKEIGKGLQTNWLQHNLIKFYKWRKNDRYSMFIR